MQVRYILVIFKYVKCDFVRVFCILFKYLQKFKIFEPKHLQNLLNTYNLHNCKIILKLSIISIDNNNNQK